MVSEKLVVNTAKSTSKLEEFMKKIILAVVMTAMCLGFNVSTALAQSCNGVRVANVGTSTASASNLIVTLTNQSGAACGAHWANGANQIFQLTTTNTDQMYAGLLTALSLNSRLFANTLGNGQYLDVLIDISIYAQ
jgi:hypothetical protein